MIINLSQDQARTMNALRASISFYKANNSSGIFDRALQKEEKMLKQYFNWVRRPTENAA
jgi:hypothetical protein